jgi:hypothetical protein
LRRKVSRFEAMNGNRIGTGAQLECKGMRRPFETGRKQEKGMRREGKGKMRKKGVGRKHGSF